MPNGAEHLNLAALDSLLRGRKLGKAAGWPNEVWDVIDSTNTRALELAKQGAPEGVIIGARQQQAGRGRLGRTWVSPPDAGLYLSFILRPITTAAAARMISFAAGVAAVEAIEETCGFRVGLKWVNDIICSGKKLGGILAEMAATPNAPAAIVVGIGINLRLPVDDLPPDLALSAVFLEQVLQQPIDANRLASAIANKLEDQYDLLVAGRSAEILSSWKSHSVTLGKQIRANTGQSEVLGTAVGIASDGALIVHQADGSEVLLHAGDVSIRNADGTYA